MIGVKISWHPKNETIGTTVEGTGSCCPSWIFQRWPRRSWRKMLSCGGEREWQWILAFKPTVNLLSRSWFEGTFEFGPLNLWVWAAIHCKLPIVSAWSDVWTLFQWRWGMLGTVTLNNGVYGSKCVFSFGLKASSTKRTSVCIETWDHTQND